MHLSLFLYQIIIVFPDYIVVVVNHIQISNSIRQLGDVGHPAVTEGFFVHHAKLKASLLAVGVCIAGFHDHFSFIIGTAVPDDAIAVYVSCECVIKDLFHGDICESAQVS